MFFLKKNVQSGIEFEYVALWLLEKNSHAVTPEACAYEQRQHRGDDRIMYTP